MTWYLDRQFSLAVGVVVSLAHVLGTAIGQPNLRWVELTDAQMLETLVNNGLPVGSAAGIVDFYKSLRSGQLGEDYTRQQPALGQVKLEDFAQEFAAAFHHAGQS
jgi:hypothetical protein